MHTSLSATLVVFLHLCSQLAASSPLVSHSSDRGGIVARNSEPTSNTPACVSSSSSHIKLKRNQAAQHARRTDPLVLEAWAERQASRLKRRYARPAAADAGPQHRKRQRGYAELHNMYADTEYFAELSIGTPSSTYIAMKYRTNTDRRIQNRSTLSSIQALPTSGWQEQAVPKQPGVPQGHVCTAGRNPLP